MIPFKGIENRADIADLKPGNRVLIKEEHDLIIIAFSMRELTKIFHSEYAI